jgi:hypothetical protein
MLDPEGIEAFPSWARKAASSSGTLLFKASFAEFSLFDRSAVNEPDAVYEAVTDSVTVLTIITTRGLHTKFIEMHRVWAEQNLHSSPLSRKFNFVALSIGRHESRDIWDVECQVAQRIPSSNNTLFPPKEASRLQKFGDIAYTADNKTDTRNFDRMLKHMTTPIANVMLINQHVDQHADVVVSRATRCRIGLSWTMV